MLVPRSSVVRQKRAAGEKSNHRPPFRRGRNLAERCVARRVDVGLCLVVFVVRERLYLHAQSSIGAAVHGTAGMEKSAGNADGETRDNSYPSGRRAFPWCTSW